TEAVEALHPVFEAERLRGNNGSIDRGDHHDTRASWRMRFPLDIPALEAEFEFGDRIEVRAEHGGAIILLSRSGEGAFAVWG
ncbi:hypothetical protein, partial [Mesorhizobium japonicum]|uniref:hypothetical protein n=1 Tax=Mesorhizobium japonicum TaxID=2066070 RepID=UPI003B5B2EE4